MKKIYFILAVLLGIIISAEAAEIKANPILKINTFDNKIFDLKEKRGKVIIINFWAKWCADCRKELLILDEIYRQYKAQDLEIIGVNIEKKRNRQKILETSSTFSYSNSMFYEAIETNLEEPRSVPALYIIDKNRKLIAEINNFNEDTTKKDLENILKPLLK